MAWRKLTTTTSTYLLLDACVIIDLHHLHAWDALTRAARIAVPSIVVHDEAQFVDRDKGAVPTPLDLPRLVSEQLVEELTASAEEVQQVLGFFDPSMREGLHAGELEALAILSRDGAENMVYCTADQTAIQSLAMLGLSEHAISMETMLRQTGLRRDVPWRCSEQFFAKHLDKGSAMRLQGRGKPY